MGCATSTADQQRIARRPTVRSTFIRAVFTATSLTIAIPALAYADGPMFWLVPGSGAAWPPAEFQVKDATATYGAILGCRLSDAWALEFRGHHASVTSDLSGVPKLGLTHGEGNLTWFAVNDAAIAPYLTAGAGAIRSKVGGNDKSKFAWNGGAGVQIRLTETVGLRIDARDVSYKLVNPVTSVDKLRHSVEVFGGISFGFGGKTSDDDGDGVPSKIDRCPATPTGARVDVTGCPLDGDGDGVFDGLDRCDRTPAGATVDATGCPLDGDSDGVYDGIDACAGTPAGARVDGVGCPLDSDADGVSDGRDQCEGTSKGCIVNPNGCPSDADQDGVCDGLDKCPDTQADVRVDVSGCPIQVSVRETEMIETGMIRLQDINFETGKATIKGDSYKILDDIGNILIRWPQLRIEIGGHTDSRGSEARNQELSEARAKAVLDYLLDEFPQLNPSQFTVAGFGEREPIATNKTPLGMAKNRRVEFKVLNTEVLKKQTEKQQFVPKE
jgi:outer membrane protein OmpA-like peptidoglycan-associated protein